MNKKIMLISIMLLALLIISAIPAYAVPTKGQKVEVSVKFTPDYRDPPDEDRPTGNVLHRLRHQYWKIELIITDGLTLYGTALSVRETRHVTQKGGENVVLVDYYVFWFPDEEGGFEGNGLVMLKGFIKNEGPAKWEKSLARGLFQGTGAFEGQTLNIGHPWWSMTESPYWIGYWLKR